MNSQAFVDHIKPDMASLFGVYLKQKSSYLDVLMRNGGGKSATDTTHKWSDMQLAPKSWDYTGSTITAATLNGGNANVTIADTTGLQTGMILYILEGVTRRPYQLIVKSITNATTFVVDVYGGTTAVNLVAGTSIRLMSRPIGENNKSFDVKTTQLPIVVENYTQIFETSIELSGTVLNGVDTFTNTNTIGFHLNQAFVDIERQLALQALFGRKVKRNEGTGDKGSFGGIDQFVNGIVSTTSSTLNKTMIADLIASISVAGGRGTTILCSTAVGRKLTSFNTSSTNPVITQSSTVVGNYVMSFLSDIPMEGGLMYKIIVDDSLSDSELFLLNDSNLAIVPMQSRGITAVDGSVNGQDGATIVVRGEYTMEVWGGSYSHAKLSGFTL